MTNTVFINMPTKAVTEIPVIVDEGIRELITNKRAKEFHQKINSFISSLVNTDMKYFILNGIRNISVYVYCKETVDKQLSLLNKLKNNEPILTIVKGHTPLEDIPPHLYKVQNMIREHLTDYGKANSVEREKQQIEKWLKRNSHEIQEVMNLEVMEYTINIPKQTVHKTEWNIPLHELNELELNYIMDGKVTSFIQSVPIDKSMNVDEPITLSAVKQFPTEEDIAMDETTNSIDDWDRTIQLKKVVRVVMYCFLLYLPIQSKLVQVKPTNELIAPKVLPKGIRLAIDNYDNEEELEDDEDVRYEEVALERIDYIKLLSKEEMQEWIETNKTVKANILSMFDNYCNTKLTSLNRLSTSDQFKMLLKNIQDSE